MQVFSYNPGVRDMSGQIIGQGIAAAGQSLGQGIEKAQENYMEGQMLEGIAADLATQGFITAEDLQKFTSGGLGKRRGIVTQGLTRQKTMNDMAVMQAQFGHRADLERLQHDLRSFTPDAQALALAEAAGYGFLPQSRTGGTYVPLPRTDGQHPGSPTPEDIANAQEQGYGYVRDPSTGQWKTVRLPTGSTGTPGASAAQTRTMEAKANQTQANIDRLARDIAAMEAQIDKRGEDAKRGFNWLPWTKTLGEKRDAMQSELESLQSDLAQFQSAPAPATPPAPAPATQPAPAPGPGFAPTPPVTTGQPVNEADINGFMLPLPTGSDPGYNPSLFDPQDPPPPGAPATPPPDALTMDALVKAADALRRGAPLDAVADRLQQSGVDPFLLDWYLQTQAQ
jgi:hypothetical protein